MPGQWGDRIILRLEIDPQVPFDTQLVNLVELTTPEGYASHENGDAWTREPYWNASVDKNFGWGTLVPGGEVGIQYPRQQPREHAQHHLADRHPAQLAPPLSSRGYRTGARIYRSRRSTSAMARSSGAWARFCRAAGATWTSGWRSIRPSSPARCSPTAPRSASKKRTTGPSTTKAAT